MISPFHQYQIANPIRVCGASILLVHCFLCLDYIVRTFKPLSFLASYWEPSFKAVSSDVTILSDTGTILRGISFHQFWDCSVVRNASLHTTDKKRTLIGPKDWRSSKQLYKFFSNECYRNICRLKYGRLGNHSSCQVLNGHEDIS